MLHQPCILRDPQTKANQIKIGCLNPAFWGAQKWAQMLHHPYILGGPQQSGQNQSGPKRGPKCYIKHAFSGIPNKGDKSKRAQRRAEMLHHPCILGDAPQRGQIKAGPKGGGNATSPLHSRGSPNKGEQNENWVPQPCLLGGPTVGANATPPLHSRGSPTKGTKSKRTQERAEMLHHPCILGDPQQRGQNQSGPKRGPKCYITPAFSGLPNKGDKSKRAQKRAEMLHQPCILRDPQTKANQIKFGCLNPAFWGAQKWAQMLHHTCIPGGPQQKGQNQSGPKRGRKCYITPAFAGIPNKGDKSKRAPLCLRIPMKDG